MRQHDKLHSGILSKKSWQIILKITIGVSAIHDNREWLACLVNLDDSGIAYPYVQKSDFDSCGAQDGVSKYEKANKK
jgi:hypothetical protein